MTTAQDVAALRREIAELRTYLPHIRLRDIPIGTTGTLQIIGGNLQSGIQMIQYVDADADPALTKVYDPAVDTVYPTGLGHGYLRISGGEPERVLIRHDFDGFTDPLMGGDVYIFDRFRTMTATTTDAPPGSPSTGDKYIVGNSPSGAWAGHAGQYATWNGSSWDFTDGPSSLGMSVALVRRG